MLVVPIEMYNWQSNIHIFVLDISKGDLVGNCVGLEVDGAGVGLRDGSPLVTEEGRIGNV
jgi:hypothetical protein